MRSITDNSKTGNGAIYRRSSSVLYMVVCVLSVFITTLAQRPAQAQLTFNLTPALQDGFAGSTITFSGTLSNTGATTLFLNGLSINFTGAAATYLQNNDPFFLFPDSIAGNGTYTGDLFTIDIAPGTPDNSLLDGQATFQGGATINDFSDLASQNFQVLAHNSSVAPEPGTLSLVAFILTLSVIVLDRSRRRPIRVRVSA